jgi:hypothetical protein
MKPGHLSALALATLLSACGGGGEPAGPSRSNGNPTASLTVSDSLPLVGATPVSFVATGSDPDGDALSYSWNFGDGATATGAVVTHVFGTGGTFNVAVTVSDGKGGGATANASVNARSLTGVWTSQARAWNFEIQQVGGQITGRLLGFKNVSLNPPPPLFGTVKAPRSVAFDVPGGLSFAGTVSADAMAIPGTLSEGSRNYGDILDRQLEIR